MSVDPEYYVGLMSGTNLDGIDAALVAFEGERCRLAATHYEPFESGFRDSLREVCYAESVQLRRLGELDAELGLLLGACANRVLAKGGVAAARVDAIGSHGQTLYHHPSGAFAFSWQIGDPNRIAETTGIRTVADFRRADMAAGGQGAPLVPAFHQALFQSSAESRAVLNLGGIANLTLLPKPGTAPVLGFDTGPGNTLMDAWIHRQQGVTMDKDGAWARSGSIHTALLDCFLSDAYFQKPPPKSTGQEYFSQQWLDERVERFAVSPEDVQATLCQLTARSVAQALRKNLPDAEKLLVCGGGARNAFLQERKIGRAHV
jgi:anhydro-N-acetylmuramic acid kinase